MDNSKIFEFSDLEELKESVKNDLIESDISSARFPIRFIFLNSHDELKEVVDLLKDEMEIDLINISKFLSMEDGWIPINSLITEIKSIEKNSVVVPFSEYIRFLKPEDFTKILNNLAAIEDVTGNFKVYVPLVGLWERFDDQFWKNFTREEWAPIWKLNTPYKRIKIYQVTFDLDKRIQPKKFKLVSNTNEWFELWKQDQIKNIISLSRPLYRYFENTIPDKTFDREIINNPKEFLSKILYVDVDIPYISDEDSFWNELLIYVSNLNKRNICLKDIFSEKFNINNIDELELEDYVDYLLDHRTGNFSKWIAKNMFISSPKFKDTYLYICLNSLYKIGRYNLARLIWLEIFNLEYPSNYFNERRRLLKKFKSQDFSSLEKPINQCLKSIENESIDNQLEYLTNTTEIEKERIFNIIQSEGIEKVLSKLEYVFPQLYHYLDWNLTLNNEEVPNWVVDYFEEYNSCKVLNSNSEKLESILSKTNHPNNFRKWHKYLLNSFDNDVAKDSYVIWIDALGAEWLPILTYFLNKHGKEHGKKVKYKTIMSVDLPSATKFNSVVNHNDKKEDLDKYIHQKAYNYPKTLITELKIMDYFAKEISLLDYNKITITSDHGFTFLCTKNFKEDKDFKKHSFENTEHEGRYFLANENEYSDTEDYLVHVPERVEFDDKKYVVSLKHISLDRTPFREVHGGATPEEVLVPFIVYETMDTADITYEISTETSEINISNEKEITVTIYPNPISQPAAFCNKKILPVHGNDGNYVINLNGLEKGEQKIIFKINDEKIGEIYITIQKGGMEETVYDFGF